MFTKGNNRGLTDEQEKKRVAALKGRKCPAFTEERKDKIRKIMLNKIKNGTHPNYNPERHPRCQVCGKELSAIESKHCNKHKGLKGDKNPQWRGGKRAEHEFLRGQLEYKIWRNSVYKRDKWLCKQCGVHCSNKTIVAHHLKSFSDYPELRYNIDNGITLCRNCHCGIHSPHIFHKTAILRGVI